MQDFAVLTGLVLGITQLIKGFIPSKWVPLTSVVLGVAMGMGYALQQNANIYEGLVMGLIASLSANGLYDNVTKPLA
jgi:hypothetical protein